MRVIVSVLMVLVVGVASYAVRLTEIGGFLDVVPSIAYGIDDDRWTLGVGGYSDLAIGENALLRISLATPVDRIILRLGFEYVRNATARASFGTLLSVDSDPGGPKGAQVDVGLYVTPIRNEVWSLRIAGFPFGGRLNNAGNGLQAEAFFALNVAVDTSLALSDRLIFSQNLRGGILLAPALGQPLLPIGEYVELLTRAALNLGLRMP